MQIVLYNTKDDANVINKNLVAISDFEARFIDGEENISSPSIIITTGGAGGGEYFKAQYLSLTKDANMAYIPILNRYYFIVTTDIINDKLVRMTLRCDVLMTYQKEIMASIQFVDRSTTAFNSELEDSEYKTTNLDSFRSLPVATDNTSNLRIQRDFNTTTCYVLGAPSSSYTT